MGLTRLRTTTYPDGGTRVEAYYLDGSLKKVTGTAVHPVRYEYGADYEGSYTKEIKLTTAGADTSEWTRTYTDLAGRPYKTVYAAASGTPISISCFNSKGQLTNQVDPDGVSTLYAYNAKGQREYEVIDLDQDSEIDFAGADRITRTANDVVSAHGTNVRRSRTYVWSVDSSSTSNLVSMTEISVDGLRAWRTLYRDASTPVVSQSQTVFSSGGNRYTTNTAPDGSYTVTRHLNGRLTSVTRKDALNSQLSSLNYSYDAHGRQSTATDARNGTTTYGYNNADLVSSVTTPVPGAGQSAQTTTTYYNKMLQATNVLNPDGTSVTTEYLLTGEPGKTYGSRTYPAAYSYDYTGRMKTMTNWSGYPSTGARVTTWNYNGYRGFLTNKVYDGGAAGPFYTYTAAGRLQTREWARGITTTYGYDNAGDLKTVVYSDGVTANVTNTYDRRGRQSAIVLNGITDTLAYNDAGQLLSETFSGGILNGLAVTNAYDAFLRRTAVGLNIQPTTVLTYGYDAASRLSAVTNSTSFASYTYLANSPLISQIDFNHSGIARMTTTKQYDYLNRLTQVASTTNGGAAPTFSFSYTYNDANQRTRKTEADSSYWVYTYDSLGQVTNGKKYWSDGTPVAGQQFEYAFDDIGNRTQTGSGGDATGANLRQAGYAANTLNQYTSRDVPGYLDILGLSIATNTVTVNGSTAYRKGEYFRKELSVDNSSAALWTNITVEATGQTSTNGYMFVAKTNEVFGYDLDGNLTNDGRWTFTWDAENRLTKVESLASGPAAAKRRVTWEYDGKGRRIRQTTEDGSSGTNVVTEDLKFANDGWRCLAELNATNNALVRRYAWGLDVSGSMDGAGGVGGLLWMKAGPAAQFCAYDGNGNVVGMVRGSDGLQTASYEYDPFGQTIRMTGVFAKSNPFRFSTKRTDNTTDFVLYEYRVYKPSTGSWLSRDPSGEKGGYHLYNFVVNDPIRYIDPFGLKKLLCIHCNACRRGGDKLSAGHSAIALIDTDVKSTTTYGLWPDDHPDIIAKGLSNREGSDVRINFPNDNPDPNKYPYQHCREVNDEQVKKLAKIVSQNWRWSYTQTCASFASDVFAQVTAVDIDADDVLGIETPREIGDSIERANNGMASNAGSTNIPPAPGGGDQTTSIQ